MPTPEPAPTRAPAEDGEMRVLALVAPGELRLGRAPAPKMGPRDVLTRPLAIGLCGTDFHIFQGEANFHCDPRGRPIPLERAPQILGHEIYAQVLAAGAQVGDLAPGDAVLVDQGWNCHSQERAPICEFCASGDSHQCEFYLEQGITGLPGGLAERLSAPAVNAVRGAQGLDPAWAVLAEPLACVAHASQTVARAAHVRFRFGGERPIRRVLICGAGPSGLLFLQYLRQIERFDGEVFIADPAPLKRRVAAELGGEALDPGREPLVEQVLGRTGGRGVEYVIEASGNGPLFADLPGLIRKQATVLLYGVGHHGAPLQLLNDLQFKEARLICSVGASGGFDADGRPEIYRRALEWITAGTIRAEPLITHRYSGLEAAIAAFGADRHRPDYIKGVVTTI